MEIKKNDSLVALVRFSQALRPLLLKQLQRWTVMADHKQCALRDYVTTLQEFREIERLVNQLPSAFGIVDEGTVVDLIAPLESENLFDGQPDITSSTPLLHSSTPQTHSSSFFVDDLADHAWTALSKDDWSTLVSESNTTACEEESAVLKSEEDGVSEGEESIASKGEEDIASKGEEDVASKGEEDVASKGEEDLASKGEEDVASKGEEDVASKGEEDVAPKGEEDLVSKGEEDVALKGEGSDTSSDASLDIGLDAGLDTSNVNHFLQHLSDTIDVDRILNDELCSNGDEDKPFIEGQEEVGE